MRLIALSDNWFDEDRDVVKSKTAIPAGKATVRLDFDYDGAGKGEEFSEVERRMDELGGPMTLRS